MITENYCTFEQAKKLKEKGFPQVSSSHYYDEDGEILIDFEPTCGDNIDWSECIVMPTLSLVAKWLREEKEISIVIGPVYHIEPEDERDLDSEARRDFTGYWTYYIDTLKMFDNGPIKHRGNDDFKTYEDALKDAINEALNLI